MKHHNILITGGLGFIFSHVAEYFASRGNKVTVLDNLSTGSHPELKEKWEDTDIRIVEADINDIDCLWDVVPKFDIIIHAAAESDVDKSIHYQKAFLHSNVSGTLAILEFARRFKPKMFLNICTDEVYGSSDKWCTPNDLLRPANPYSASKAAASHMCWAYANTYGVPMQEVRMCNIIGRRQATTKLLPRLIERIKSGEEMPIYDGGTNTREYMDVRDVGPLLEQVLDLHVKKVYNLTSNQELSILGVLGSVERILGKKANVVKSTRPGHDTQYRMKSGILSDRPFKNIERTIEWILEKDK